MIHSTGIRSGIRQTIAKLMVLVLFAQVLMPLQSHTRLVRTDGGRMVVLCTLQGLEQLQLDDQGQIVEKKFHSGNHHSAAVKFSQLLGGASLHAAIDIALTPITDSAPRTLSRIFIPFQHRQRLSIRAPPVSIIS